MTSPTRANAKIGKKGFSFFFFFFTGANSLKMQASLNYFVQSPCFCFCMSNEPNSRMENIEFGIMSLNVNRRRRCTAAYRRIPPSSAENICTKKQRVRRGWPAAIFSKHRICQKLKLSFAAHCALEALSLCSYSFVCLMTSLRGLLALDSRSQNERIFRASRVFKGAPSKVHDWQFLSWFSRY